MFTIDGNGRLHRQSGRPGAGQFAPQELVDAVTITSPLKCARCSFSYDPSGLARHECEAESLDRRALVRWTGALQDGGGASDIESLARDVKSHELVCLWDGVDNGGFYGGMQLFLRPVRPDGSLGPAYWASEELNSLLFEGAAAEPQFPLRSERLAPDSVTLELNQATEDARSCQGPGCATRTTQIYCEHHLFVIAGHSDGHHQVANAFCPECRS